jgi:hypothetical protein
MELLAHLPTNVLPLLLAAMVFAQELIDTVLVFVAMELRLPTNNVMMEILKMEIAVPQLVNLFPAQLYAELQMDHATLLNTVTMETLEYAHLTNSCLLPLFAVHFNPTVILPNLALELLLLVQLIPSWLMELLVMITTIAHPQVHVPLENALELILCAMEFVVMELLLKRKYVIMEQTMESLDLAVQLLALL